MQADEQKGREWNECIKRMESERSLRHELLWPNVSILHADQRKSLLLDERISCHFIISLYSYSNTNSDLENFFFSIPFSHLIRFHPVVNVVKSSGYSESGPSVREDAFTMEQVPDVMDRGL